MNPEQQGHLRFGRHLSCAASGALAMMAVLVIAVPVRATSMPAAGTRLLGASIPFAPNAGQWPMEAAFGAQTFAGAVFVTTSGQLRYNLRGSPTGAARTAERVLMETLVDRDARPRTLRPAGIDRQQAQVSYFVGDDTSRHRAGLPTFQAVHLGEVYPGIEMQVRATGANVEKIFTVAPHHDPDRICIRFDGVSGLRIGENGELIADTPTGPVSYTAPIAFQETQDGAREPVAVRYVVDASAPIYAFALGAYDRARPLTIDPVIASTYLGGSGVDAVNALAIAAVGDGSVYVAGQTTSTNFPATAGSAQFTHAADASGIDAFVARFDPQLSTLLGATYFGGNGDDAARTIALTDTADVLIAGTTTSTNLPGTASSAQPASPGAGTHGFVARLNPTLTILTRTTYVGGNANTGIESIAITPDAVYVTGSTFATNLPATLGAAQPASAGLEDAFVARLVPDLTSFVRTSYFGGTSNDRASAVAIHPQSGDVYIAGEANSPVLPGITGGGQPSKSGSGDGFIARLSRDLGSIRQSSYYGGTGRDAIQALAVHPLTGEVYASGFTHSTNLSSTAGSAQSAASGGAPDAFVLRMSADLRDIQNATYFGGTGNNENAPALAIHPASGEVYVAGQTNSTSLAGTTGAIQPSFGGVNDGYVVRLRADLAAALQSTFFGTLSNEALDGIAVHPFTHDVYIGGLTLSTSVLPGAATGEFPTSGGSADGFVARLSADLTLADKTSVAFFFAPKFGAIAGSTVTSAPATLTGFTGTLATYITGGADARYCVSSAANCTCDVLAFTAANANVLTAGQSICMSDKAGLLPNQSAVSTFHAGGGAASFVITTGAALATPCSLDIDGNGVMDALSDGLIVLRALFGLTGTTVTNGIGFGAGATRTTWSQLQAFLNNSCGATFAP